jgi:hypothetical protein
VSVQHQLWVIWGAMIASLALDAVLPSMLVVPDPAAPPAPSPLGSRLELVAAGLGLLAIALRRALLLGPAQRGQLDVTKPDGLRRAQVGFVVCWAIADAVGAVGLAVAILTRDPARAQPFVLAAVLLFVFMTPRLEMLRPPGRAA